MEALPAWDSFEFTSDNGSKSSDAYRAHVTKYLSAAYGGAVGARVRVHEAGSNKGKLGRIDKDDGINSMRVAFDDGSGSTWLAYWWIEVVTTTDRRAKQLTAAECGAQEKQGNESPQAKRAADAPTAAAGSGMATTSIGAHSTELLAVVLDALPVALVTAEISALEAKARRTSRPDTPSPHTDGPRLR